MDPVTPTLAIGATLAAVSAASTAAAAYQQNQAIQRSMQSQVKAAKTQQEQLADAASVERLKTMRTSQQLQGRIRVAAAQAGATSEGSFEAFDRQAAFDAGLNTAVIDRNLFNQQRAVRSGTQANLASLSGSTQNPFLAAFGGGVQGMQSGLAIGGAVDQIGGQQKV